MKIAEEAKAEYNSVGEYYRLICGKKRHLTEFYTSMRYLEIFRIPSQPFYVLDLGCGSGDFMKLALESDITYIAGMDISHTMVTSTQDLIKDFPVSKYTLSVGNCLDPETLLSSYTYNQFNHISAHWLINYAENIEQVKEFFVTCKLLLKPRGTIFGLFPNDSLIDFNEESYSKSLIKIGRHKIIEKFEGGAISFYKIFHPETQKTMMRFRSCIFRRDNVRRAMEAAGFEVIRIGPIDVNEKYEDFGFTLDDFKVYIEEVGVVCCFVARAL